MKLENVVKGINTQGVVLKDNPEITDIVYDSRQVKPGALFVAVEGYSVNGNDFIPAAIEKGAVAIISTKERMDNNIAWIQVEDARVAMAEAGFALWGVDFNEIFSVAVTGTNGKTTIATIMKKINESMYGRIFSWQIGTIGNWYGDKFEEAARTTPEAVDLLKEIGNSDFYPKSLTMEVSSHALVLERVKGFLFDVAIFTNLTQDHLDFHKTMEEYYDAKKILFSEHLKSSGVAVINCDDDYGRKLANEIDGTVVTYGRSSDADFRIISSSSDWNGSFVRVVWNKEKMIFKSPLVGHFNIMNLAAVAAAALSKGVSYEIVQGVFEKLTPVPGRMDKVAIEAEYSVVVDYAHTPDALKNVLYTAKKITNGKVIAVFGAGGDRDRTKRAPMAEAVALNADYAFITSDNPRTEEPSQILSDVEEGMPLDFPYKVIADRREAITEAMKFASAGDAIIIAGKGHEDYQEIMGVKHHFDDREEVQKAFVALGGAQ